MNEDDKYLILYRIADKVEAFDVELRSLIEDLIETMHHLKVSGLAAPEIGISRQVLVINFPEYLKGFDPNTMVIINPKIIPSSQKTVVVVEACLTTPQAIVAVERFEQIVLTGLDANGFLVNIPADGWLAYLLQHEVDHINGIINIDLSIGSWYTKDFELGEDK